MGGLCINTIYNNEYVPLGIENYSFAYISCFMRPIYYEMNRINIDVADYLLCLHSLMKSYPSMGNVKYDYQESRINSFWYMPDTNDELAFMNDILNTFFGCHLSKTTIQNKEELMSVIENNINDNRGIIVPINPVNIYYSDFYKVKNWTHYLYCTGIDRSKDLVEIIDHMQFGMESTTYNKFYITFDMLYSAHKGHNQAYPSAPSMNSCYSIHSSMSGEIKIKGIDDFLLNLKSLIDSFVVKDYISCIESDAFNHAHFDNIFSYIHLKTLYNDVIIRDLNTRCNSIMHTQHLFEINDRAQKNKKAWDELGRKSKIAELRKKPADIILLKEDIPILWENEKSYLNSISELIDKVTLGRKDKDEQI